jgi:hypothetical protein
MNIERGPFQQSVLDALHKTITNQIILDVIPDQTKLHGNLMNIDDGDPLVR